MEVKFDTSKTPWIKEYIHYYTVYAPKNLAQHKLYPRGNASSS